MDNSKYMYDAWFDDILDDVRDNALGEYWSKYLNYKYYREILKDLLHRSKLVHKHKYPSRSSVLHVNYDGDYEVESPSKSVNYIKKYEVPENELNELHHVYYLILKQIVKTQGEEKNMLTESIDSQKEFLDKVVDRLLKESEYKLWEDKNIYNLNHQHQKLNKIRVEIKFALINTRTEEPIEFFSMDTIKNSAFRRRRRKKEYLEDYEEEHLTNIYGLNSEELEEVIFNYYTKLYNNIYKSYLEMNEDDKVPTNKPEEWFRGDEVFDIGGRLNESLSSRVNKDVDDLFSNNKKLTNEKEIKSIFMDKYGMNKQDADQAMVIYLSKQQSLNESIEDKQGRFLDRVIEQLVNETIIYPSQYGGMMISLPGDPDENWDAIKMFDHLDYLYNRFLTHTIKHCRDVYGLTDEEIDYVWDEYFHQIKTNYNYLKGLNESTEKPKGMDLKYLYKVADSIMKEIEIDDDYGLSGVKVRGYSPWNEHSTGHYGFWTGLEKHAKDTYALTQAETEMVSRLIWDSLNSKNIYLSDYIHSDEKTRNHFKTLNVIREQHYEEWDERSREQNINLLKTKGIDILSTDINVPFYRRIDSKEIRFLKKITDRLDKESRIESVGDPSDGDYLLITPFGKFEYFGFMNEYRHSRFEKYVNDMYAVGENQIMFPTGNSIAQARESAFLWEMYKDKLRRKQLKLVNPGLPDIPDDAIITERHLYDTWREKHLNYGEEQNKEIFKDKGITVLSTDINVPFYKRIDSKEIRFLNNVANRMDEQTKIEIEGPTWIPRTIHHNVLHRDVRVDPSYYRKMNTITFATTPFGKFQLAVLFEDEKRKFKKYVDNAYAVGDNQIMFPVGNNITQTTEIDFLWAMYTDKLKRKHLKLINPDLDIPDDDFIREKEYQEKWSDWRDSITESTQDLTGDEHKSLLQSFGDMGTPPEIASEELGELITWVKDLPEELFLYRVLYLDDENKINYDELGSHYSQDRTDLINNHYNRGSIYGHGQGEDAYLITVKVPKSEVDVMETLNNNILYPHEKEITLKDKGRGAKYLDIEKI